MSQEYFAVIFYRGRPTGFVTETDESGHEIPKIWYDLETAEAEIRDVPLYQTREINIYDALDAAG